MVPILVHPMPSLNPARLNSRSTWMGHLLLPLVSLFPFFSRLVAQPGGKPASVLWTLSPQPLSAPEQALAASLQGLLNRTNATLWFKGPGASTWVLEELRQEGTTLREAESIWALLEPFRTQVQGFITCRIQDASLNAATSLAGLRDAVVADASIREHLQSLGFRELFDARGLDDAATFTRFGSGFTRALAVHQPVNKPLHLRDYAVAHRAFTFFDSSEAQRREIVRQLGPAAHVLGWGASEREFVGDISIGGGVVIPSDWALNLSALEHLTVAIPRRPVPPPAKPLQEGERVVAFVVTDGDNVQWLLNGFVDSPGFWASPLRGQFAVTWELAPTLAQLAPRVLARLFRTVTVQDDFIAGPSGVGYYFPSLSPSAEALARQTLRRQRPWPGRPPNHCLRLNSSSCLCSMRKAASMRPTPWSNRRVFRASCSRTTHPTTALLERSAGIRESRS